MTPAAPVYAVGDTVYIENDAYQITELREDTVHSFVYSFGCILELFLDKSG